MLYTMATINKKNGVRSVIYGHATLNVIQEYLNAYVDVEHNVEISLYEATPAQLAEAEFRNAQEAHRNRDDSHDCVDSGCYDFNYPPV